MKTLMMTMMTTWKTTKKKRNNFCRFLTFGSEIGRIIFGLHQNTKLIYRYDMKTKVPPHLWDRCHFCFFCFLYFKDFKLFKGLKYKKNDGFC